MAKRIMRWYLGISLFVLCFFARAAAVTLETVAVWDAFAPGQQVAGRKISPNGGSAKTDISLPNVRLADNPYERFSQAVAEAKIADPSTIALQFFGDIMLDRNVAKAMRDEMLDYIFAPLGPTRRLFGSADLTIANLEGPFAEARVKTGKSIAFRFDPVFATELRFYGFNAVNLANNHLYDMGRANVAFTRQTLKKAGLGYFGDELQEGKDFTWITEVAGQPVAFIGLHNVYRDLNMTKVKAALKDAKERARYVIINIHWGDEYQRISNAKQRALARQLIDLGADAVIGHHPHVIQEMEIYQGKPIFYSLGNFIFDQYFSEDTQEGLSAALILQGGSVKDVYVLPFYGIKSQVYVMAGERREKLLSWFSKNSRLGKRSIEDGRLSFRAQ